VDIAGAMSLPCLAGSGILAAQLSVAIAKGDGYFCPCPNMPKCMGKYELLLQPPRLPWFTIAKIRIWLS
jgi:hypothetical protein